jgi:hypothetical protein
MIRQSLKLKPHHSFILEKKTYLLSKAHSYTLDTNSLRGTTPHIPAATNHCIQNNCLLSAFHWQPFHFHNVDKSSTISIFSFKFIYISLFVSILVLDFFHAFFHTETRVIKPRLSSSFSQICISLFRRPACRR